MPVRIIRRSTQAKLEGPAAPVSKPRIIIKHKVAAPATALPVAKAVAATPHGRGWQVGPELVLAKQDFSDETEHAKFLVHRVRKTWYLLRGHDEDTGRLALTSPPPINLAFESKVDTTTQGNYVVVLCPADTSQPSDEVMSFIHRQLPSLIDDLQISANSKE